MSRRMKGLIASFAVCVLFMILSTCRLNAQTASRKPFDLYGVDLRLGDNESVVIAELKKLGLTTTKAGDDQNAKYLVLRPAITPEGKAEALGAINFERSKLVRASKTWFGGPGSAFEFANVIQKVFAEIKTGQATPCFTTQEEYHSPETDENKTDFVCGDRMIEVVVVSMKSRSLDLAQIDEVLQDWK